MPTRDLTLSLVASVLIGAFLIPTLINTEKLNLIPSPYLVLFVGLPALTVIGMFIAKQISNKISALWQVAKFGLVGVLNTSIDFGILNALMLLTGFTAGEGLGLINVPSFSAAIVNSYFWNRKWVFEKAKKGDFRVFATITVIALLINTGILYTITKFVPPQFGLSPILWATLAKAFATGFSMVWNFTGYKLIVFKR